MSRLENMEICPSMGKEAMRRNHGVISNPALLQGGDPAKPGMTSRMTNGMICTINRTKNARDRVEDHKVEDLPANLVAGDTKFLRLRKARSAI